MAPCSRSRMFPVRWRVGEVQIMRSRSQGPLSSALLCSSFPPSLFSNDVIYSIINHLTAIVHESNPLNIPWEQPQGRRQVSRKCIKENADRELRQGTGEEWLAALCRPFSTSWDWISNAQGLGRPVVQTAFHTLSWAAPGGS